VRFIAMTEWSSPPLDHKQYELIQVQSAPLHVRSLDPEDVPDAQWSRHHPHPAVSAQDVQVDRDAHGSSGGGGGVLEQSDEVHAHEDPLHSPSLEPDDVPDAQRSPHQPHPARAAHEPQSLATLHGSDGGGGGVVAAVHADGTQAHDAPLHVPSEEPLALPARHRPSHHPQPCRP
jgi:hypothetical protein